MKIGITVDDYKLDIFEEALRVAEYEFRTHPGPVPGTKLIRVNTEDVPALQSVVIDANMEAKRRKRH